MNSLKEFSKKADNYRVNAMQKIDNSVTLPGQKPSSSSKSSYTGSSPSAASPGNVTEVRTQSQLDGLINSAEPDHLLAIDFYANWCPPCKTISPVFAKLSETWRNVTFLKIDVDTNKPVSQAYEVKSMPTFVFIKNGKEVDRLVGATEPGLKQKIEIHAEGSPNLNPTKSSYKAPPPPPSARTAPAIRPAASPAASPSLPSRASGQPASSSGGSPFDGIFVNISEADKEAFFALLDEYFSSRPELFNNLTGPSASNAESSSASNSFASQAAAAAAPALATAALRNPSLAASAARSYGASPKAAEAIGKFGASHADSLGKAAGAGFGAASKAPLPPPSTNAAFTPSAKEHHTPAGLSTGKKWGSMDTSSGKSAFGSIVGGKVVTTDAEKQRQVAARSPVTTGLATTTAARHNFAPPPSRMAAPPTPPPAASAETARALYDYEATDGGDLQLREGDVITITEHVSEDWWKGTIDGREGIFPANYVEIL